MSDVFLKTFRLIKKKHFNSVVLRRWYLVAALVLGLLVCLTGSAALAALNVGMIGNLSGTRRVPFSELVASLTIAPIVEEYIFRYEILSGLLKRLSSVPLCIGISTTAFALVHLNSDISGAANVSRVLAACIAGAVMGYFFVYTRSLVGAICLHFATNLSTLTLSPQDWALSNLPVSVRFNGWFYTLLFLFLVLTVAYGLRLVRARVERDRGRVVAFVA